MKLLYITTKYIMASSIKDALKKEKDVQVHDCYLEKSSMFKLSEGLRPKTDAGFNNRKEKK